MTSITYGIGIKLISFYNISSGFNGVNSLKLVLINWFSVKYLELFKPTAGEDRYILDVSFIDGDETLLDIACSF